jgi:tRNA(Ile)-lysidine synthase
VQDLSGPSISQAEFARLMAALCPFETAPHVAVAVSGGADSMAACLLTDRWTRARRGKITALVVDHGLRTESSAEARCVARRLRRRGISCRILTWRGDKPTTGIQAAARTARYALLSEWCARAGVLHLVLGHHREDQAETVRLREQAGSGPDGLAGMAAIVELRQVRLLRPLLPVARARLRAVLERAGERWVEDPSNLNLAFARARLRAGEQASGRAAAQIARAARAAGRLRAARETRLARFLAQAVALDTNGRAEADAAALAAAQPDLSRRALARLIVCVGGRVFPPRGARLDRLHAALREGSFAAARTLGGCRIHIEDGRLIVAREPGRVGATEPPSRALLNRVTCGAAPADAGWAARKGAVSGRFTPPQPLAPARFSVV